MRGTLLTATGDVAFNIAWINNLSAVVDPAVTDDQTKGYSVGSCWINTLTQREFTAVSVATGAAVWINSGASANFVTQGAPAAKTVSATLTAAELGTGILTVNQGGGATSTLTLPLATAMDTAFPQAAAGMAFDFSLINISTVAAENAIIATNTGWTTVGDLDVAANNAATTKSAGRFRARKTGTGAWTLYRLS